MEEDEIRDDKERRHGIIHDGIFTYLILTRDCCTTRRSHCRESVLEWGLKAIVEGGGGWLSKKTRVDLLSSVLSSDFSKSREENTRRTRR